MTYPQHIRDLLGVVPPVTWSREDYQEAYAKHGWAPRRPKTDEDPRRAAAWDAEFGSQKYDPCDGMPRCSFCGAFKLYAGELSPVGSMLSATSDAPIKELWACEGCATRWSSNPQTPP